MDSINFTANHIKNINIQKRYYKKYVPQKVALVKLDAGNKNDISAVSKTADKWDYSYTVFTHEDMVKASRLELEKNIDVFALTTQKSDYDKLKPSKILGIIEVMENHKDGNKIEVLQTNSKYAYDFENMGRKFKNIGKSLVQYVQKTFNTKPLYLHPTNSAMPFYEKLGFKKLNNTSYENIYYFSKKI